MALKFGSKSGTNFNRSAFPMQKGTASHASAVKQVETETDTDYIQKLEQEEAKIQLAKIKEEQAKKVQKKAVKKELKEKGVKDDEGMYILGETESADEKYDPEKDYSKPDPNLNLSPEAAKKAEKKNKKKLEEIQAKEKEEADKKARTSEKTVRLREEVKGADFKTEQLRKREEKALDIQGMTGKERRDASKKGELGYLGKGLFGGYFKRKRAGKKYEKSQKKEDKLRKKLGESEMYDEMTPEQKIAHDRERQAFLTAKFSDDAKSMQQIAQGGANKQYQTEGRGDQDLKQYPSVGNQYLSGIEGSAIGGDLSSKVKDAYDKEPGKNV